MVQSRELARECGSLRVTDHRGRQPEEHGTDIRVTHSDARPRITGSDPARTGARSVTPAAHQGDPQWGHHLLGTRPGTPISRSRTWSVYRGAFFRRGSSGPPRRSQPCRPGASRQGPPIRPTSRGLAGESAASLLISPIPGWPCARSVTPPGLGSVVASRPCRSPSRPSSRSATPPGVTQSAGKCPSWGIFRAADPYQLPA